MEQTTFNSEFVTPASIRTGKDESLLKKIRDRLQAALKARRSEIPKKDLPPAFIEAHLLDDVLGAEIKRTLRV